MSTAPSAGLVRKILNCTGNFPVRFFPALEAQTTPEKRNKFLIVENDPNDAYLIRRALTDFAHCGSSMVCRNPSEAKAYLRGAGMYQNRDSYPMPDVIITDMRMGDESGMELVDWIREQEPPLRDMPIIILSGSCSPLQFEAASKMGANAVHRKPTRLHELQELLASIAREFCSPPSEKIQGEQRRDEK